MPRQGYCHPHVLLTPEVMKMVGSARSTLLPTSQKAREAASLRSDTKTFFALVQIVSAPKVRRDLAEFQFPLAVDFCPGVGHVAIARVFSGDDQLVGDDG